MRARLAVALVVVLLLLAACVGVVVSVVSRPLPGADVIAANDIAQITGATWPDVRASSYPEGPDFIVLDAAGNQVLARGLADVTELDAAANRWPNLPVRVDGEIVGVVIVADSLEDEFEARDHAITTTVVTALGAVAAALLTWAAWLWWSLLRPFRRLERFAADVAIGDLDAPLDMDRHNAFGSFTEAFDVMRTELAESREREAQLAESKRTLVSQLSHDIRTPVASIGATAELLKLTEGDPARADKLDIIEGKVVQVTELLDELSRASSDDLTALPVMPADHVSDKITELISKADTTGAVTALSLSSVLVSYDPKRLQQVLDNVLANAAKYAGTPVEVTGEVCGPHLCIRVTDYGSGVPDDELDLITRKRVRGSNAAGLPGSGLGLYTSSWLMEQMGGELRVRNIEGGFQVQLDVPLAN